MDDRTYPRPLPPPPGPPTDWKAVGKGCLVFLFLLTAGWAIFAVSAWLLFIVWRLVFG